MEIYAVLSVIVTLCVMLSASHSDWRSREVSDVHWWILGSAGILLTAFSLGTLSVWHIVMLAGTFLLLIDILLDRELSTAVNLIFNAVIVASFVVPAFVCHDDPTVKMLLVAPICTVIFYILYQTGAVKGGADAKCLMVLSMMFPVYPVLGQLPLIPIPGGDIQLFVPFSAAILFHACLFSFIWFIWVLFRKIHDKERLGMRTIAWYHMDIDEAEKAHVWPKQDVIDGRLVIVKGDAEEGVYDRLRSYGAEKVWVTPIIPFMVPITLALLFVMSIGNILFIPFI